MNRDITVGIIGAGQLARMMYEAATPLGVPIKLLAETADSCAAKIVHDVTVGDYTDPETVARFAAQVDVLTFDHEHVPTKILTKIQQTKTHVYPSPQALVHAQDKIVMRKKMDQIGVANPKWRMVQTPEELIKFGQEVGWPIMAKTSRGGYDGKGTWKITTASQAEIPFKAKPKVSAGEKVEILAEEFIDFSRELSVLVVRNPSGQAVSYPVSESRQVDGICVETITPAPHMSQQDSSKIQRLGLTIAKELDVVGVLAVELMETPSSVMVNELAMRPHNTGHWTIDGAETSQFENHIRAVLDLPLGDPSMIGDHVVMNNVLGGKVVDLTGALLHCFARDPKLKAHIYGKEIRPGRKVGHVCAIGEDLEDTLSRSRHGANYLMGIEND